MSEDDNRKLYDLRVIDLKTELIKRKLDTSGKKSSLIERLRKALISENQDPETYIFKEETGKEILTEKTNESDSINSIEKVGDEVHNESDTLNPIDSSEPNENQFETDSNENSVITESESKEHPVKSEPEHTENTLKSESENENSKTNETSDSKCDHKSEEVIPETDLNESKITDQGESPNNDDENKSSKKTEEINNISSSNDDESKASESEKTVEDNNESTNKDDESKASESEKTVEDYNESTNKDDESKASESEKTVEDYNESTNKDDESKASESEKTIEDNKESTNKDDENKSVEKIEENKKEEPLDVSNEKTANNEINTDNVPATDEVKQTSKENESTDAKEPPKENKDENTTGTPKIPPSLKNLWVSNIPSSMRANDLKKLFSEFGKVNAAKLVMNTKKSYRKCYGYIAMDTEAEAAKCIEKLNNTLHNGKQITVEFAKISMPGVGDPVDWKKVATEPTIRSPRSNVAVKPDVTAPSSEGRKSLSVPRKHSHPRDNPVRSSSRDDRRRSRERSNRSHERSNRSRERSNRSHERSNRSRERSNRSRERSNRSRERSNRSRERSDRSRERRWHRSPYRPSSSHRRSDEWDIAPLMENDYREQNRIRESRQQLLRKAKEEESYLIREREKLAIERARLEKEKCELLMLERQQLEREKLKLERLELKRQQVKIQVAKWNLKRTASPVGNEHYESEQKRFQTERMFEPPPPPSFDTSMIRMNEIVPNKNNITYKVSNEYTNAREKLAESFERANENRNNWDHRNIGQQSRNRNSFYDNNSMTASATNWNKPQNNWPSNLERNDSRVIFGTSNLTSIDRYSPY